MVADSEIDCAYAQCWMARVTVTICDGRGLEKHITSPKRDPDNALRRPALDDKAPQLATYSGGAREAEMAPLIARVWRLYGAQGVYNLINKNNILHNIKEN